MFRVRHEVFGVGLGSARPLNMIALLVGMLVAQAGAESGQRIAIVRVREALAATADGKAAVVRIESELGPEIGVLEKSKGELKGERKRLARKHRIAWPWRARRTRRAIAEIGSKLEAIDATRAEIEAVAQREQVRAVQEIGKHMVEVINAFARERGYALVLDESATKDPALRPVAGVAEDVTDEVVVLYDRRFGAGKRLN